MEESSLPSNGNSDNHIPPFSSSQSLAPPVGHAPPYASTSSSQRYLPPGAAYALHSPAPSPTPPQHRLGQPPVLSLSIGSRGATGTPSPLVGSAEWPTGSSPSPSPSTNRNNSPYPLPSPVTADPSFTGIPSGRLQYPSEPSPRQTQSAHFPSFNLPPNLPPNDRPPSRDRAPHPPHVRSQSTGNLLTTSTSPYSATGGGGQGPAEESEFLADRNGPGAAVPRSSLSPTPLQSTRPLSIADQVVGTPPPQASLTPLESASNLYPGSAAGDNNRRSYYLEDNTTPITPSDMAGVGRNSIIRSVGATSPVANFRSSIGPSSPNLDSTPATTIQQQGRRGSTMQIAPSGGGAPAPNPTTGGGGGTNTLPPHLVAQPEICVECMMRDRDMADVDVTSYGIWERESDRDWREQLEWEREQDRESAEEVNIDGARGPGTRNGTESQESGGERRRDSTTNTSHHSRESNGFRPMGNRRKLGRGQALTSSNLKAWTTMNPPAAAHRWKTLQTFLATQLHMIELDRQAHARESALLSSRDSHHAPSQNRSSRASTFQMPISTTPEPYEGGRARAKSGGSRGYLVDETNRKSNASSLFPPPTPHQPHPQTHSHSYPQPSPSAGSNAYPTHPQYIHPSLANSGASIQSYSYGDQPWLSSQSSRRYSYSKDTPSPPTSTKSPAPSMKFNLPKFARSTTDLRSISSPRSLSPARNSLNVEDRDYGGRRSSTSLWSKFRNSTSNQSVLSFNPSASMMDMHLGLSQDKHGMFASGGQGAYRNSGYASSTIGIAQRGYSYHQPQSMMGTPYDTYPGGRGLNMSDPSVARHAELRERDRVMAANRAKGMNDSTSTKEEKKKKGIKGFFSKLVGGSEKVDRDGSLSKSAPATPTGEGPINRGNGGPTPHFDDDELAPPPPLSALANEPRYHQRSSSTSSVDSFTGPYTPPLHPSNFRSSYAMPLPSSSGSNIANAADRQSIMSYSSARSKPTQPATTSNGRLNPSKDSVNRPSFDSINDLLAVPRMTNSPEIQQLRDDRGGGGSAEVLAQGEEASYSTYPVAQPRLQKSLPALPNDNSLRSPQFQSSQPNQFYPNYQSGASRSAYSLVQFPSRPLSPPDSADERDRYSSVGSRKGNARKTRSTVFSFFGGKKKSTDDDALSPIDTNYLNPQRARSFDLVSRY
ncbi:uncharacterized protein JCM6883_001047 [Sporobolomyces salmoneus]|uniref:uncharacterized protein n=1 Tax=Sporobolomyces salmoneus TaxID=183962 RepID=UPI0031706E28